MENFSDEAKLSEMLSASFGFGYLLHLDGEIIHCQITTNRIDIVDKLGCISRKVDNFTSV